MTDRLAAVQRLQGIRRIGVFRALMLGDLLCATPALRAIRAAWPDAEVTLIGLPWTRGLASRWRSVDTFVPFPGKAGLPEIEPDEVAYAIFSKRMRAARLDLMVQLHGSGSIVNEMLADLGARHACGFADTDVGVPEPSLHVRWPRAGHEIDRLLHLTDHLGLPRQGRYLDFPLTAADTSALHAAVPALRGLGPYACVHAGSQLPSRRWPPARFAQVADRLAATGLRIVLTGTEAEAPLAAAVRAEMRTVPLDLTGRTNLFTFGALIRDADLLVCNDTGALHVAAAVGTPSVAVSSGADVARWAPLDTDRHAVHWHAVACRPCSHAHCPTGHECALGVGVEEIAAAALDMLARWPRSGAAQRAADVDGNASCRSLPDPHDASTP